MLQNGMYSTNQSSSCKWLASKILEKIMLLKKKRKKKKKNRLEVKVRRKLKKKTEKKLKREKKERVKKKRIEGGQNERRGKKEDEEVIYFYQFSAYFVGWPSRPLDCSPFRAFLLVLAAGWLACVQRPRCKYSLVASLALLVVSIELHLFTTCFCCATKLPTNQPAKHVAYCNT